MSHFPRDSLIVLVKSKFGWHQVPGFLLVFHGLHAISWGRFQSFGSVVPNCHWHICRLYELIWYTIYGCCCVYLPNSLAIFKLQRANLSPYDWPSGYVKIAIENGHWNSWFTHEKWWFSIVMLVYQRVVHSATKIRQLNATFTGVPHPGRIALAVPAIQANRKENPKNPNVDLAIQAKGGEHVRLTRRSHKIIQNHRYSVDFKIFQDISRHFKTFQDISRYISMLPMIDPQLYHGAAVYLYLEPTLADKTWQTHRIWRWANKKLPKGSWINDKLKCMCFS